MLVTSLSCSSLWIQRCPAIGETKPLAESVWFLWAQRGRWVICTLENRPNGTFWQFGVGMRVSPEITEYQTNHTSWYIAQYDVLANSWMVVCKLKLLDTVGIMIPWFIPAPPRSEADEVPETFDHQRNCASIKYGSSMQKKPLEVQKKSKFSGKKGVSKTFQTFL